MNPDPDILLNSNPGSELRLLLNPDPGEGFFLKYFSVETKVWVRMLYVSSETHKQSVQAHEKPQALQRDRQTWNFLIFPFFGGPFWPA